MWMPPNLLRKKLLLHFLIFFQHYYVCYSMMAALKELLPLMIYLKPIIESKSPQYQSRHARKRRKSSGLQNIVHLRKETIQGTQNKIDMQRKINCRIFKTKYLLVQLQWNIDFIIEPYLHVFYYLENDIFFVEITWGLLLVFQFFQKS